MKADFERIRDILLDLAAAEYTHRHAHTEADAFYLDLLSDRGLVALVRLKDCECESDGLEVLRVARITWDGLDFIELCRDQVAFRRVIQSLPEGAGPSLFLRKLKAEGQRKRDAEPDATFVEVGDPLSSFTIFTK